MMPKSVSKITGEVWKTISGFPDYSISNMGRVARLTTAQGTRPGLIGFGKAKSAGYPVVNFRTNGKTFLFRIHVLVLETFIGPRPLSLVSNHKDGDKNNNCLNNLEWVTRTENILHAYRTGLRKVGPRGPNRRTLNK